MREEFEPGFASHTYFFLQRGRRAIFFMVTIIIASFLEIITILGQDSGRANEITDPQNCSKVIIMTLSCKYLLTTVDTRVLHIIMAIEMAAASISAAISMQINYFAMANCVTVKSKQ